MKKIDYKKAHTYSNNHKPDLIKDSACGCFYCLKIFHPSEIEEWLIEDNAADKRGTAICPYCGIDAVLGESSGFPITTEFLADMNREYIDGKKEVSECNMAFATQEKYSKYCREDSDFGMHSC